jgi:hypothetical protein
MALDIDTSKPRTARIYDYYLGGENHFAADRETADKALQAWPSVRVGAREQRKFLVPPGWCLYRSGGRKTPGHARHQPR